MWASLAQKAAATEEAKPIAMQPRQRVIAVEVAEDEVDRVLEENLHQLTAADLPSYTKGIIVLDANAIIKGLDDFLSTADCFVTIPQVIAEIKDRTSRDLLDRLPFKLVTLDPSSASIQKVIDVAKRTGDFGVLSRTDIRLAALAYDCARATGSLRAEITPCAPQLNPQQMVTAGVVEHTEEVDEDDMRGIPSSSTPVAPVAADAAAPPVCASNESAPVAASAVADTPASLEVADGAAEVDVSDDSESVDSWDDPEAGEWITPQNIHKVHEADGEVKYSGGFACATTDFPMQNVLLHLGCPTVGLRGMQIRQLRTWLLRCHACFALIHDTTRQFCSECGSGDTLKRVSYSVKENGEKHLYINFKRHISTRGTVFNLPKPRGGRRGTNKTLALREDQLAHVIRGQQNHRAKEAKIEADDDLATFGEVKTRRFNPDKPREQSSYKKYNVNERKKMKAGRRK